MIWIHNVSGSHKVPCGKCAYCLVNRRSQWMFRIHHEMRSQDVPGYFITLTYDEKHVPRVYLGGENLFSPSVIKLSLRFKHVQLFLKRVRKAKYYAKYVCVGEYGPQTKRPHYHMLLWTDCPATQLEYFWEKGQIHFGKITMQSAMYTLKYIIQPKQQDEDGVERTRAQFSKGLGLNYLSKTAYHFHTFDYDRPVMFASCDGRKVALPRYYKQKIFTKYQMRQEARRTINLRIKQTNQQFRDLRAQGIKGIRPYLKALRVEQARRIISNTKYNQTL